MVDQVLFLYDYRQILVTWRDTVQLICYEGDCEHVQGGRHVPDCERTLPLNHDFSFHKVAMEGYGL